MFDGRTSSVSGVLLLAASLAGCAAVGPDYRRPAATIDPAFVGAGATSVNAQPPAADIATFWRGFNDPRLNALVERALEANGDIRIAQARLQEARANLGEAEAAGLPGVGIQGGVTRAVTPSTQQPGSRSDRTGTSYNASFLANWELDFFGRYRRGQEAAAALVDAGAASLQGVHTSISAEVARNYLGLRGLQQRQAVVEAGLVNQRESLRIVNARVEAGRSTQLDLARARTLVASTEASLPVLQSAVERAVFRLSTLTAQAPRELLAELSVRTALPALPVTDLAALPVGTPVQWLQRRPDIAQAERQLAAATAGIGVATSELYPRISLSGLLGLTSGTIGNLVNSGSAIYSLGAGLTWTAFDFGAIRSRIAASEARALGSLATYEQTVITALEEVEGAFSSYTRSAQRSERLVVAATSAEQAAQLARARFEGGVTDFLAVLDAEREVLNNRDQLVQSQTDTATALVSVYRALGGGWTGTAATVAAAPN